MAKLKPRIGDVVCVKWDDPGSWRGWEKRKDASIVFAEATTDGTLVASDSTGVSISGTCTDDGEHYLSSLDIPRGCIKSIRVTRRPRRQKGKG